MMRLNAHTSHRIAGALLALGLLVSPSQAATPVKLYGKILGVVTDATGIPQMGAVVSLFDRQEKFRLRVLTDERGMFLFDDLAAGAYSVRVSLSSFVPVLRSNILVQPGERSLLNVNLATLFSSIELVYPWPTQTAIMSDDWKWVLRTSNATRPVLRLLPELQQVGGVSARSTWTQGLFSDTRGMVKVSAGEGGRVTSFGNESDLGTAFALATSLYGKNQLSVSGNVGYGAQTGMPSAGFRTSYSRGQGVNSPEVTLTMRQLFLPGRVGNALGSGSSVGIPALKTMSLSFDDTAALTDSLSLDYGFSLDSVTFFDRLNYASPYARLKYTISDGETIELGYSSGVPRADIGQSGTSDALQSEITALALFPRVSMMSGRAKVHRAENYEIGYTRIVGSRTFRAAVSRENVRNAALTMTGGSGLFSSSDVLPDLFSNSSVFNAGSYQSLGYMASMTQELGSHLRATAMFSSGGALVSAQDKPVSGSPDELRAMIRQGRRRGITAQVAGTSSWTGTNFVASYQWSDGRAATPAHYYMTQRMRADAGLNIYVRQPLPVISSLPVRFEASADLRNLLAQGYLPFTSPDGQMVFLMHTPRSVRGGLSFIF